MKRLSASEQERAVAAVAATIRHHFRGVFAVCFTGEAGEGVWRARSRLGLWCVPRTAAGGQQQQ